MNLEFSGALRLARRESSRRVGPDKPVRRIGWSKHYCRFKLMAKLPDSAPQGAAPRKTCWAQPHGFYNP